MGAPSCGTARPPGLLLGLRSAGHGYPPGRRIQSPQCPSRRIDHLVTGALVRATQNKTSTYLSDGRELLYFDEVATDRSAPDTRDLLATETNGLIRLDPVLDEWTMIASHRQSRTHLPPADQCPLCPSTPLRASEVPASSYDVVVFENR